ncbi:MAG: dienelactone hydrolase family protein [Candidatus Eremiobacteraeota bacterium]|nr:dienelactone hydrolase family protein [Candidatus Eremiobacteraeota bacterium]
MSYDPFIRGRFSVGVRSVEAHDPLRKLRFPLEVWYPAAPSHFGQDYAAERLDSYSLDGTGETRSQDAVRNAEAEADRHPLVIYSHGASRWKGRGATFLCTHLASHGYVVAAIDHYETLVPNASRDEVSKNRVADISFAIDFMLGVHAPHGIVIESSRIAAVGYSFGGWTVLAAMENEARIRAVVALAPAGASKPKPGIFNGKLSFKWKREAPMLLLSALNDVVMPQAGMRELFKRAKPPKRAFVLQGADHLHFLDCTEEEQERARDTEWPEELQWLSSEMRPAAELLSGEKAHAFTNGMVLAHLDANLLWKDEARRWFRGDMPQEFAARHIPGHETGRAER